MLPIKETQHVATAQALLIDQFKNKTVIQGYLSTLARRVQEVENVLWDIIELRRLDLATGIQLDALGKLVGEKRIGRNDTDYRTGIRLRIRVNRSKGRIADVIDVAMLASNVLYPPRVTEYAFLGFQVEIYGQTGERYTADLLSRTRAATSYGVLVASDLAASALLVWDDAVLPQAGLQTFSDAISGGLVCASAYGLPSDFTGIVLGSSPPVAPTLSSVNFSLGDTQGGGQNIVATGLDCLLVTQVNVFGNLVAPISTTATTVTFALPAHAPGTGTIALTNPAGTSNALAFEYWTPLQLTGVDLYFDSNKGVAGSITSWTDQVGAVVATPAATPTLVASVFGSLPAIRFVPQARFAFTRRNDASYDAGISVFAVAKWTSTDTTVTAGFGSVPLALIGDQTGGNASFGASAGALAYSLNGSATVGVRGSGLNTGNPLLVGLTFLQSTNAAKVYLGAAQQGATDTGQTFPGASGMGIDTLGNGFGNGDGWAGDWGALIVTKGAAVISGTDLTKLNSWAQQRFGTA